MIGTGQDKNNRGRKGDGGGGVRGAEEFKMWWILQDVSIALHKVQSTKSVFSYLESEEFSMCVIRLQTNACVIL